MAKFKVIHPITHGSLNEKGERISTRYEPGSIVDGSIFGKGLAQLITTGSLIAEEEPKPEEKKPEKGKEK